MRKIYLSLFVMALTVMMTAAPVAAFFSASAAVNNNTFSTGTLDLRLFYDCVGEFEAPYGFGFDNAIVECPRDGDGSNERLGALKYNESDGAVYDSEVTGDIYNTGDWDPSDGWWGGLSSAIDHTFIYPGWSASTPPWEESDLLSVGNSGDLPLDLSMTLSFEAYQAFFEFEPLDGTDPGGDRIDPHTDWGWVNLLDREYSTALAEAIELHWERVDNDGNVVAGHEGTATLADLIDDELVLGELLPGEVAYIRFNWEMPETDEDQNEFQNKVFDYTITFDGVQQAVAP